MDIIKIQTPNELPASVFGYAGISTEEAASRFKFRFGFEPEAVYVYQKAVYIPVSINEVDE